MNEAQGIELEELQLVEPEKEEKHSIAKFQGYTGLIAITVGNIAATITHVEEIRKFIAKMGTDWIYRFHDYIVFGTFALLLLGYGSLAYWLYRNFVADKRKFVHGVFYVVALVAISLGMWGTYTLLLKPVNVTPFVKAQVQRYVPVILSQQVSGGEDDGGFRFSQTGISDVQVWTTAQCLTALLQQDVSLIRDDGPAIKRAFDYIERSRLKSDGNGWGYLKKFNWGVTEIDAWVALAYLYSLKPENAGVIWTPEERADVISRANLALRLIVERQHSDGGWSVIELTSNFKHERTYSSIMALWALAEAEQHKDFAAHKEYGDAVTLGAKWLLQTFSSNEAFWGWWPNPTHTKLVGEYPALTAHALFVLSQAKATPANRFIEVDPKYRKAVEAFIDFALSGNDNAQPLLLRNLAPNEGAHDSDRYLEGRSEVAESSSFLWYPWTIAAAVALEHDTLMKEYQQRQLKKISSALLARTDDVNKFINNDAVIYPTAEILLVSGYSLSKTAPVAPEARK